MEWFVCRNLKKRKQEKVETRGLEKTRWIVWVLRLEMRGDEMFRDFEVESIRDLAIKLAVC